MRNHKLLHALLGLMACLFAQVTNAAPNVVVSVAPLHSLVAALMQGVGEPVLLIADNAAVSAQLDPFQKSRIITADLLIWSGAGYETAIAQMLTQSPALETKLLTLSKYVPLLAGDHYDQFSTAREQNYDLTFWHDPKLAAMAVKMLTPRLVRLDPEHAERYLDNEIALLSTLMSLQKEIHGMFASKTPLPGTVPTGVNRYFAHRFMAEAQLAVAHGGSLRKVATNTSPAGACDPAATDATLRPGPAFYFESMRHTAIALSNCMQQLSGAVKTAAHVGHKPLGS